MKFDMELNEAGIRRFWSIQSEECNVTITHGKSNNKGAHFLKSFENYRETDNYVKQSVQTKLNSCYKITKNSSKTSRKDNNKQQTQAKRRRSPRLNNKKISKSSKILKGERQNLKASQERATQQRIKKSMIKSKQQHSAPNLDGPQGEVDTRIKMSHRYTIFQQHGFQYDLLTKSNSSYYIVQILVDQKNHENFKLYTRWGSHGSVGRYQLTNCRDVQHTLNLFALKFSEKTGRKWDQRIFYRPKRGNYVWINPLQFGDNMECSKMENQINKDLNSLVVQTNSCSTNQTDVEVQDGDGGLDDLISQILSPTLSESENEDFNVHVTWTQCRDYY
eukprot:TRINITY_DN1272_c1_g1_i1.p1 TRINITY_DN1272_c1_g1~~TRINITY_DN1272_c1_g1_i1.p1  ORF type:complete len:333 (-),score=21.01 TRINITY_DN1272_c1_g1_i1:629-1627(-)